MTDPFDGADPGEARPLPLEGLLVVSVEQAVAAPFASRQLADMGARVIKIERPDGGDFARAYDTAARGTSSHFAWLNRGKESMIADLKAPADRELLEELVSRADVFIQNLAPGSAARLGIDSRGLVKRYPRLVACDISGYGSGGPYEHRKAYDLLIQCETGFVAVTGDPERPAKAGVAIADIAGGMYALTGILTALYEREHTGRGTALEISLFDALSEWMGYPAIYGYYLGADPPRTGAAHASIAPYGPFATSDGSQITLAVQNDREWQSFCATVIRGPELTEDTRFNTNPNRIVHRAQLDEIIGQSLAKLDPSELTERLEDAGIAFGIMRPARLLAEHPQHTSRKRWVKVDSPGGQLVALKPPVIVDGRDAAMGPIPALGEHDAAVRAWLKETRP